MHLPCKQVQAGALPAVLHHFSGRDAPWMLVATHSVAMLQLPWFIPVFRVAGNSTKAQREAS